MTLLLGGLEGLDEVRQKGDAEPEWSTWTISCCCCFLEAMMKVVSL